MKNEQLIKLLNEYLRANQKIENKSPREFRSELIHKAIEFYIHAENGYCDKRTIEEYYSIIEKEVLVIGYLFNGLTGSQLKAQKLSNEKSCWDINSELVKDGLIAIHYRKPTYFLKEFVLINDVWFVLEMIYENTNKLISAHSKFRGGKKLPSLKHEQYRKVIGLCIALPKIKSETKFCEFVGIEDSKSFNKWKNEHRSDLTLEIEKSFSEKELNELKQSYLDSL